MHTYSLSHARAQTHTAPRQIPRQIQRQIPRSFQRPKSPYTRTPIKKGKMVENEKEIHWAGTSLQRAKCTRRARRESEQHAVAADIAGSTRLRKRTSFPSSPRTDSFKRKRNKKESKEPRFLRHQEQKVYHFLSLTEVSKYHLDDTLWPRQSEQKFIFNPCTVQFSPLHFTFKKPAWVYGTRTPRDRMSG